MQQLTSELKGVPWIYLVFGWKNSKSANRNENIHTQREKKAAIIYFLFMTLMWICVGRELWIRKYSTPRNVIYVELVICLAKHFHFAIKYAHAAVLLSLCEQIKSMEKSTEWWISCMTLVAIINDFGPISLTAKNATRQHHHHQWILSANKTHNYTQKKSEHSTQSASKIRVFNNLFIYAWSVKRSRRKFHKPVNLFGFVFIISQCSVSNSWNKFSTATNYSFHLP